MEWQAATSRNLQRGGACMKVLLLPNENAAYTQIASRKGFARLQNLGRIAELEIFSYRRIAEQRGIESSKAELLEKAASFQPQIIFLQHLGNFPLEGDYVAELKRRSACTLLVYHDEDPFDGVIKRIGR